MVKVAGIWELGWNAPLSESYLWTFVLREFGIKEWFMSPVSGIKHNEPRNIELIENNNFQTLLDLNSDLQHVYIDEKGETDLREFEHPQDALYIFGRAGVSPMQLYKKPEDLSVYIPTKKNSGVLWPHQCLLTVFYDRECKGWR